MTMGGMPQWRSNSIAGRTLDGNSNQRADRRTKSRFQFDDVERYCSGRVERKRAHRALAGRGVSSVGVAFVGTTGLPCHEFTVSCNMRNFWSCESNDPYSMTINSRAMCLHGTSENTIGIGCRF